MRRSIRLAPLALLCAASIGGAQPPAPPPPRDFAIVDTLAPGVVHRRLLRAAGPWELHVLEIDLRRPELRVEAVHAGGALTTRATPSRIARTLDARWCPAGRRVLAAVNGDLFELATGENEGNQIVAGSVLKAGRTTDSPFDAIDVAHVQFAIDARGRPLIERFAFDGVLRAVDGTRRAPLDGVNARRGGAAVLFTTAAGRRTPDDSARRPVHEAPFTIRRRAGDTLWLRRAGATTTGGRTPIPVDGAVLSVADGSAAATWLREDAPRDLVAELRFAPDRGPLRTLVGGWGHVLDAGVNVALRADTVESLLERFAHARHGRTAVGFDRDSTTLYLVTVDGRRSTSVGMTLVELGDAMRSLGAWHAMNLDGGGSTSMNVGGRVVNVPSDSAGERTVGNAVVVVRRGVPCR